MLEHRDYFIYECLPYFYVVLNLAKKINTSSEHHLTFHPPNSQYHSGTSLVLLFAFLITVVERSCLNGCNVVDIAMLK